MAQFTEQQVNFKGAGVDRHLILFKFFDVKRQRMQWIGSSLFYSGTSMRELMLYIRLHMERLKMWPDDAPTDAQIIASAAAAAAEAAAAAAAASADKPAAMDVDEGSKPASQSESAATFGTVTKISPAVSSAAPSAIAAAEKKAGADDAAKPVAMSDADESSEGEGDDDPFLKRREQILKLPNSGLKGWEEEALVKTKLKINALDPDKTLADGGFRNGDLLMVQIDYPKEQLDEFEKAHAARYKAWWERTRARDRRAYGVDPPLQPAKAAAAAASTDSASNSSAAAAANGNGKAHASNASSSGAKATAAAAAAAASNSNSHSHAAPMSDVDDGKASSSAKLNGVGADGKGKADAKHDEDDEEEPENPDLDNDPDDFLMEKFYPNASLFLKALYLHRNLVIRPLPRKPATKADSEEIKRGSLLPAALMLIADSFALFQSSSSLSTCTHPMTTLWPRSCVLLFRC